MYVSGMTRNSQKTGIAPHTEYTHTHGRCVGCGETVPRAAMEGSCCPKCAGRVSG